MVTNTVIRFRFYFDLKKRARSHSPNAKAKIIFCFVSSVSLSVWSQVYNCLWEYFAKIVRRMHTIVKIIQGLEICIVSSGDVNNKAKNKKQQVRSLKIIIKKQCKNFEELKTLSNIFLGPKSDS